MARSEHCFSPPACQRALSRDARRAAGVYYTPPEIVRLIIDLTLEPLLGAGSPPRILDPACGAGEFLVEAQRRLDLRYDKSAARGTIFGIDVDALAVSATRQRLREVDSTFPEETIQVGDALHTELLRPGSFNVILGNPPYVNIRQLAKSRSRERIEQLRQRFATARGNFDLYVLFIERAIELLKPGGRCGLIVPNKWAALDYARPCRELLLAQTTIERVIDLSPVQAFAAGVYPHVVVFRKEPARIRHTVQISEFNSQTACRIAQRSLTAAAIHLAPPLDVESRVSTQSLGQVAALACGTAGYAAQKIARRLVDCDTATAGRGEKLADFITSGNIDRYQIRLGEVRYLNRNYVFPRLPLDLLELTPAKRRLFASPKIVIAGMSRRLESAWDDCGLALGVQVFAASDSSLDPFYLLALLNSKLLSYLFATRYAAKRLGGGYLAINKGQLARLPVRIMSARSDRDARRSLRLSELAANWNASHETEIDQLVYRLYGLTSDEIARVESHFAGASATAA